MIDNLVTLTECKKEIEIRIQPKKITMESFMMKLCLNKKWKNNINQYCDQHTCLNEPEPIK